MCKVLTHHIVVQSSVPIIECHWHNTWYLNRRNSHTEPLSANNYCVQYNYSNRRPHINRIASTQYKDVKVKVVTISKPNHKCWTTLSSPIYHHNKFSITLSWLSFNPLVVNLIYIYIYILKQRLCFNRALCLPPAQILGLTIHYVSKYHLLSRGNTSNMTCINQPSACWYVEGKFQTYTTKEGEASVEIIT